jgi:tRNA threonylcarbamoyl adenosine modification protein (Sua5/YciO/YrdC/YwlC family)
MKRFCVLGNILLHFASLIIMLASSSKPTQSCGSGGLLLSSFEKQQQKQRHRHHHHHHHQSKLKRKCEFQIQQRFWGRGGFLAAEGLSKTTTSATSSSTTKTTKTSEKSAIEFAVQALKRGSVIAVPTDTLYGFACDASNAEAIENLYAVKGREKTKPVAVCVSRAEEVKKICELDGKIEESLLRKLLPGAVTLLFKRKWTETTLSKSLNPNVDNVGVRVPDCAFILDVCDAFDGAIALTSANTSGKPSCVDVNEFRELHEKCERVFDGGKIIEDDGSTDSALLRAGSTIVDLSKGDGTFHVVRDGCALTNTTSVLLEYGFIESK